MIICPVCLSYISDYLNLISILYHYSAINTSYRSITFLSTFEKFSNIRLTSDYIISVIRQIYLKVVSTS